MCQHEHIAHYVNIMTQGNTISFGDLNTAISQSGGGGNSIRAMTFGGFVSPTGTLMKWNTRQLRHKGMQ